MSKPPFLITILTDKSSWMNTYNIKLKEALTKQGHTVALIHNKQDITKGDIAFFLSCFEIIPSEFLSLHKNNIVVHASDLPTGKGWSPMTWQILEGKNEIPVTLFEAVEECDAGDIYLQDTIQLDGTELLQEWQAKLGHKTVGLCLKYIDNYPTQGAKQTGETSFYPRRTPADSELDINKSLCEQLNLLRTVDNKKYPAFFYKDGVKYKITIEKSL